MKKLIIIPAYNERDSISTVSYTHLIMIKQLAENISYVSFYTENEKIVKVPVILATALTTVLMPRIANEFAVGNSKNIKRYIQTAFICTFFVLMPCCIGMMATAQTFVPVSYTHLDVYKRQG